MINQKFGILFQISQPSNIPQKRSFGRQVSNDTDPNHGSFFLLKKLTETMVV